MLVACLGEAREEREKRKDGNTDQRISLENPEHAHEFETLKYLRNPKVVIFALEGIERFAETKISDEVKGCEVEVSRDVNRAAGFLASGIQLLHQQVEVGIEDRLLFAQCSL